MFHYVLAYSGGFGGIGPATQGDIETQSPWMELLANSEQTKKNLRLLFLGAGQQETPMLPPGKRLVKVFKEKGVNAVWADYLGGHVFSVCATTWIAPRIGINCFAVFLPRGIAY